MKLKFHYNINPMKNATPQTINSIHHVFTSKGWEYLMLPGSVMEYSYYSECQTGTNARKRLHDTLYLN
jgi:hypothetical protein